MSESKIHTYPGRALDVTWNGDLCIHVGECGRAEGDLFEGGRKPWCQPDLSPPEATAEVLSRCPTGALVALTKRGEPLLEAAAPNQVCVSSSGPLYFRGKLAIEGAPLDEAPALARRAALCRCGRSKNKPFCDNAHAQAGFRDAGAIGSSGTAEGKPFDGALEVKPAPNGPLLVSGKFAMVAGTGRVAWSGKKAALCRCGESKNKPFCDGAHARIGFRSE